MKNIKFDDLDFWIGDMSKQEILKEVILPLINFEYRVSQLRQDILNTKQETDFKTYYKRRNLTFTPFFFIIP